MQAVKMLVVETNKDVYVVETKTVHKTLYGLVYYPYEKMKIEEDIYLIYSKNTDDILKKNFELSTINLHKIIDLIWKLIYNMSNHCKRYYRR